MNEDTPSPSRLTALGPSGRVSAGAPGETVLCRSGNAKSGQERVRVIALAVGVLLLIGVYFAFRSGESDRGVLYPYQMLARDLVGADQTMFGALKQSLLDAEAVRASTGRWPEAGAVASLPAAMPSQEAGRTSGEVAASSTPMFAWRRQAQGVITHYVGVPGSDSAGAAWMIAIREPEPGVPTDTAPNDEEHHRLPDGTVLHVSIWTHRFGAQLDQAFLAQPENGGWTQVLTAPLNPLAPPIGAPPQVGSTPPAR